MRCRAQPAEAIGLVAAQLVEAALHEAQGDRLTDCLGLAVDVDRQSVLVAGGQHGRQSASVRLDDPVSDAPKGKRVLVADSGDHRAADLVVVESHRSVSRAARW